MLVWAQTKAIAQIAEPQPRKVSRLQRMRAYSLSARTCVKVGCGSKRDGHKSYQADPDRNIWRNSLEYETVLKATTAYSKAEWLMLLARLNMIDEAGQ
jgi:hypothetical protein